MTFDERDDGDANDHDYDDNEHEYLNEIYVYVNGCLVIFRIVHIWDSESAKQLYFLPGHKGSVNDVIFSPCNSNIVASCGSDKNIFLGELSSSSTL